jgi:hypothetical protein
VLKRYFSSSGGRGAEKEWGGGEGGVRGGQSEGEEKGQLLVDLRVEWWYVSERERERDRKRERERVLSLYPSWPAHPCLSAQAYTHIHTHKHTTTHTHMQTVQKSATGRQASACITQHFPTLNPKP